jgi:hypothetical protein
MRHQRTLTELVAHAAFRYQRQTEAGLGQALLGGQAVDQGDIGAVEPGTNQSARQGLA